MKKVLLFLPQGFEEYEASVFTDVLGWSREYGTEPVQVFTTALRPEIQCTWNLIVKPQIPLNEVKVENFDALAIPGGFEKAGFYEDAFHPEFLSLIRQFDSMNKIIAAICVGALPLGKSGILNNRNATTYHLNNGFRRNQLRDLGANVLDQRIVVDGNIITSSNPSTAIEVAFILLEKLTTNENCNTVKKYMGFIE